MAWAKILMRAFFNTHSGFYMEKTGKQYLSGIMNHFDSYLTHFQLMFHFYTLWKH